MNTPTPNTWRYASGLVQACLPCLPTGISSLKIGPFDYSGNRGSSFHFGHGTTCSSVHFCPWSERRADRFERLEFELLGLENKKTKKVLASTCIRAEYQNNEIFPKVYAVWSAINENPAAKGRLEVLQVSLGGDTSIYYKLSTNEILKKGNAELLSRMPDNISVASEVVGVPLAIEYDTEAWRIVQGSELERFVTEVQKRTESR